MFQNNLLMAAASTAAPDAIVTFIANHNDTSQGSPHTFTDVGVGTAAANRTVAVAAVTHADGGVITGITCNGSAMTEKAYTSGESSEECGIWEFDLPTGTTATFVTTGTGTVHRMNIGIWALYGVGVANDTVVDAAQPFSQSITLLGGGVAIAVSCNNGSTSSATWGSDFTERYDTAVEPNTKASGSDSTGGGSKTVSVTWTSGDGGMVGVAWPKG